MDRITIDQKYIEQANTLEAEFFDIVDLGKPSQHRVLKDGKVITEFNQRHGVIWNNHEAELIAEGLILPRVIPPPSRDLGKELDELKVRLDSIERVKLL